jgi:diacylglycerol kinase family enzyme
VSHTLARRLIIRTPTLGPSVGLEIDGELLGHLPATFQVVPQALLVRCNV